MISFSCNCSFKSSIAEFFISNSSSSFNLIFLSSKIDFSNNSTFSKRMSSFFKSTLSSNMNIKMLLYFRINIYYLSRHS